MKKELIDKLKKENFSKEILRAIRKVNRKKFVPDEFKEKSYDDIPLPIGFGQTISQPYTIAFMLTLLNLKNRQKILEIGSGSGYVLELLSEMCPDSEIIGIEVVKELAEKSKKKLGKRKNIRIVNKNGATGFDEEAPFDRILVSASGREIPKGLINQLKYGGILVIPIKNSIISLKKGRKKNFIREFEGFSFVPLI